MHEKDASKKPKTLTVPNLLVIVGVGLGHRHKGLLAIFPLKEIVLRESPGDVPGYHLLMGRGHLHKHNSLRVLERGGVRGTRR